ncbi:MAG: nitroreductase family protein [Patescibacteria group bacterium]
MDAIEALKTRRSIRRYEPRPVPREILLDILDCARLAPSGYNRQHWVFVCVTEKALRERLAGEAEYGRFIAEAGACVAVFGLRGTECLVEDCCAAAENIIIAARAHGLGTCWVNSHRKEHSARIEEILGCPAEYELVALIAVGYAAEHPVREKKPLSEVMRWERF